MPHSTVNFLPSYSFSNFRDTINLLYPCGFSYPLVPVAGEIGRQNHDLVWNSHIEKKSIWLHHPSLLQVPIKWGDSNMAT